MFAAGRLNLARSEVCHRTSALRVIGDWGRLYWLTVVLSTGADFAKGYLEAYLTIDEIYSMYANMASTHTDILPPPKNLTDFLSKQVSYVAV